MLTATAEALRQAASAHRWKPGSKVKGGLASDVIDAYLRHEKGVTPDRYGNLLTASGERYKTTATTLRHERKVDGVGWTALAVVSKIDYALRLLGVAYKGTEQAAGVKASKAKRSEDKTKATKVRDLERAQKEAVTAAAKIFGLERPDVARAVATSSGTREDRADLEAGVARIAAALVRDGFRAGDRDNALGVGIEPAPWLALNGVPYAFDVTEGGVRYTVELRGSAGAVDVNIGTSDIPGFSVSALRTGPSQSMSGARDPSGDGYLSGAIEASSRRDGKVDARLFLVTARARRAGAGARLLSIWCALCRSFGVDTWLAQAVGPEGEAFLHAMARRGHIEVAPVPRTSNWAVSCVPELFRRAYAKNPPEVAELTHQSRGFHTFRLTSEPEDVYATLDGYFGPPAEVAPTAFPHDPTLQAWVRKSKARVVGYIAWLSVVERGRGIAKGLLQKALDTMRARGVGEVFLIAIPEPPSTTLEQLLNLYGKFGFKLKPGHPKAMSVTLKGVGPVR